MLSVYIAKGYVRDRSVAEYGRPGLVGSGVQGLVKGVSKFTVLV